MTRLAASENSEAPRRRPPFNRGARKGRSKLLATRMSPAMYEALQEAAGQRGLTLTDFVIEALAPHVGFPIQAELPDSEQVA